MRILLVYPPFNRLKGIAEYTFPFGLGYLASVLKDKGHKVGIYCAENPKKGECKLTSKYRTRMALYDNYPKRLADDHDPIWKEMEDIIKDYKPDAVGVTANSVTFPSGLKIAAISKRLKKETPIIFGGAHPSVQSEEVLQNKEVDFVVRGEGEETIKELMNTIETGGDYCKIDGLSFKEGNKIIYNRERSPIEDLDTIPFPDRDALLNIHAYSSDKIASIMADLLGCRGCPYDCIYCSVSNVWGRKIRARSPNNILREIELLKTKYGRREISFWEDSFTADRKRVFALCELLIRQKTNILWSCSTRMDLIDEELLKVMKKAGCIELYLGVESGSEKILKYINKRISRKEMLEKGELLRRYKINWYGYFMAGFPEETEEDILMTKNFMQELAPSKIFFAVVTPYPGTALNKIVKEKGLLSRNADWRLYGITSPHNYFSPTIPKECFGILINQMIGFVDNYNGRANFWFQLSLRLGHYLLHPFVLMKRIKAYIARRFE